MPLSRVPILVLLAIVAVMAVPVLGCAQNDYTLERQETPVQVWLTAPELARQSGQIEALIYLGAQKVVEGPIRFTPDAPTVNMPTVYTRPGPKIVSVVLGGSRISAREQITITEPGWVQITVRNNRATIEFHDTRPSAWGE